MNCIQSEGGCENVGTYTISGPVAGDMSNSTSLAVTLRNADDGYRLFYHDNGTAIHQLRYSGPEMISWAETPVVNITGTLQSVSAIATDGGGNGINGNLSVYSVDARGTITPAMLIGNDSWIRGKSLHPNPAYFASKREDT
jgi:hypothetical protein